MFSWFVLRRAPETLFMRDYMRPRVLSAMFACPRLINGRLDVRLIVVSFGAWIVETQASGVRIRGRLPDVN